MSHGFIEPYLPADMAGYNLASSESVLCRFTLNYSSIWYVPMRSREERQFLLVKYFIGFKQRGIHKTCGTDYHQIRDADWSIQIFS